MNEIRDIIKKKEWNDFKNDFMSLFAQATALTAQDNEKELEKILHEIDIVAASYRYSKSFEERSPAEEPEEIKPAQPEIQINGENESEEAEEMKVIEKIYTGEDIKNALSNEIKEKQVKEKIINIKEVPLYTFKIYDGTKYSVPEEDIINPAKILIPSNDGYDYYLKVYVAEDNVLYAEKTEFKKEYAYIKAAYIREYTDTLEQKIEINELFNSKVDVSLLETKGKMVKWVNNDYVVSARPKSDEQIRLEGNRQRLYDNKNIRFMYDINDEYYHDKSCDVVKTIRLDDLRGSENPPKDKVPCKDCLLDMYIRKGCIDDFKNQNLYRHFFIKGEVSLDTLKEFLSNENASFRIESVNKLKITCKEDTWKIETDGRGNFIRLWHNNYFVDKRGKRHVDTKEYHEQNTDTIMNVQMAVQYIMDYNYQKTHTY